jgi:hypothetical protein
LVVASLIVDDRSALPPSQLVIINQTHY